METIKEEFKKKVNINMPIFKIFKGYVIFFETIDGKFIEFNSVYYKVEFTEYNSIEEYKSEYGFHDSDLQNNFDEESTIILTENIPSIKTIIYSGYVY